MQLTNAWWLLIWLFSAGLFFVLIYPQKKMLIEGEIKYRWSLLPSLIIMFPYCLWCAGRGDINDTRLYRQLFIQAPQTFSELGNYLQTINKDKGFSVLTVIIKCIFGSSPEVYFFIIASIQLVIIVLICRKYSCDYWFSLFVFIASTDYLSWAQGGIRQFMAATIIFAATPLILKKKYIPVILIILLASTMHQSALLMIPVIFIVQGKAWNRKTVLCILASVTILFFVDQFTNVLDVALSDTQYVNVVSDWKGSTDNGTNILRVLVYAVPTFFSIVGLRFIKKANSPIINLTVNMSIISTALYIISYGTSGIFIGRLPIYCSMYASYILLPWEIENMFTKDSARLMKTVAIFAYVAFFYYQVFIAW